MNGRYTQEFESWLARRNDRSFVATCHSGTTALEIIASYYATHANMPNPPTVVLPAISYVATANAFVRAGWNIYFADTDAYGLLNTKKIPRDLSYQAVCLVGLYGTGVSHLGWAQDWQDWQDRDTIIIEDAAQHWLAGNCVRVGHAAAISFDPMKNLACYGNGGAVITRDQALYQYALDYRDNGKASSHQDTGSNCRMSELDCATMLVKTQHIDQWQNRREQIAQQYIQALTAADVRCLIDETNDFTHAFHKFVVEVDRRDQVQQYLAAAGIETKVHYDYVLSDLGAFDSYPSPDLLGACYSLTRRCLSLPLYPELTDAEVDYVASQLISAVRSNQ
jgi:dTDP-4-amino-4,6-dideoxygalactose transaminase